MVGIFIGLVVGLVVAFAVTWYVNKMPVPFREDAKPTTGEDKSRPAPASGTAGAAGEPIALPGKPGDKPLDKPRFDFYRILPGGEDAPAPPTSAAPPAGSAGTPPPQQLFLQVGAFQDAADADNLKARLALMGIEASVQQIILPDRGTLHRVRIGPFARLEDMNKVRGTLSQSGIETGVAKAGN